LPVDTAKAQDAIEATAVPCVRTGEEIDSGATVEASTVLYDREGAPMAAPVIATLDDGRRVAAAGASGVAAESAGRFLVGARIHLEASAGAAVAPTYHVLDGP
jgi:hypothetical protein